jgi:hypothetical protein
MTRFLEYEIKPGANVPAGLPRQRLVVLSPIWRGSSLEWEYPDGMRHALVGWRGPGAGEPCELQVFWTRPEPQGPAVCLAIGGDAGLKEFPPAESGEPPRGLPLLALAESLIPAPVLEVIGPLPSALEEKAAPLLLG